jgi:hypothetical protein
VVVEVNIAAAEIGELVGASPPKEPLLGDVDVLGTGEAGGGL